MNLIVNRNYIDEWVDKNGPNGIYKLAEKAGLSSSLMAKVRLGDPPKRRSSRIRICQALEISEDELFPNDRAVGERSAF